MSLLEVITGDLEHPGRNAVCVRYFREHKHNPWTSEKEAEQDWAAEQCLECPVFGRCQVYVEGVKRFPGGAVGVYAGEVYPRRNTPRKVLSVEELFKSNRKERDAVSDVRPDGPEVPHEALRAMGDRRDGPPVRQGEDDPPSDRTNDRPRLVHSGEGAQAARRQAPAKRRRKEPRGRPSARGRAARDEAARRRSETAVALQAVLRG